MTELDRFPLDGSALLRHCKRLKREAEQRGDLLPLRIAVLGGWTTHETVTLLELFLLRNGVRPEIHQSAYGKFYEDAVLDARALAAFAPQIVYIHTSSVNLHCAIDSNASEEDLDTCVANEVERFEQIWSALEGCTIVQNNFDEPLDPLGNFGAISLAGRRHFVRRLNDAIARKARARSNLIVHDLCAIAQRMGSERFFDHRRWCAYKILVTPDANAMLAHSLSRVICAAIGRARKCLILDLDNTLWGGVIGDDGPANIRLGADTPEGEAFRAFQTWCLELHKRGVLLAVCSKNEESIARSGFAHPDSILKLEHLSAFKANWDPKHENIKAIARELDLGLDAMVFVDDNPAEREIVRAQLPMVEVPEVGSDPSLYPSMLSAHGYFETVALSREDLTRTKLYKANAERAELKSKYETYDAYLAALDMRAEIGEFTPVYFDRITQLVNKTNQFNLTTQRRTRAQIEQMARDPRFLTLYARLADQFGDNGLVSVVTAEILGSKATIDLWLMSCRVLQRDMELAMLDELIAQATRRGVKELHGFYVRTEKNALVSELYARLGFVCTGRTDDGTRTDWVLPITPNHPKKNRHIKVMVKHEQPFGETHANLS